MLFLLQNSSHSHATDSVFRRKVKRLNGCVDNKQQGTLLRQWIDPLMSTSCRGGNLTEAAKPFSCRLDVFSPSDVLETIQVEQKELQSVDTLWRVGCPQRRKFGLRVPPRPDILRTSAG